MIMDDIRKTSQNKNGGDSVGTLYRESILRISLIEIPIATYRFQGNTATQPQIQHTID